MTELVRYILVCYSAYDHMGCLRLVGPLKFWVSFAKEPYKRDDILQKRPIILGAYDALCYSACDHITHSDMSQ